MNNILLAAFLLAAVDGTDAADAAETAEAQPREEEEVICRTRLIPSERVGQRYQRREICMTREEWQAERLRPRR